MKIRPKLPKVLALVVALSMVAAACSSSGTETTTTASGGTTETTSGGTATTAGGSTATTGGQTSQKPEIVAALSDTVNLIEPHTFRSTSAYAVTRALYEPLVREKYDEQSDGSLIGIPGEHVGDGAESYEVTETDNGLKATFHLRQDAKFADGTPVTASDYKYTFDRSMQADFSYITVLLPFIGVDSPDQIKVVDDYTLEIETNAKTPLFERFMTFQVFGAINQALVEANTTSDDPWGGGYLTTNAAGSGPYMLQEYNPDRQVVLTPNPYYWDIDNVANSGVTIRTVPDANQRALLVQSGDIDLATGIPPSCCLSSRRIPTSRSSPGPPQASTTWE